MTATNFANRRMLTVFLTMAVAFQAPIAAVADEPATRIQDVRLSRGGVLTTRVVDLEGRPMSGELVEVLHRGQPVAKAESDQDGLVTIAGLRPGQHEIVTLSGSLPCRFWAAGAAPPSAVAVPAVVHDRSIVRGQFGAFNLPMLVYAGATIGAVVVGVDAMNTADGAQAANARLNSTLATLEDRVKELEMPASP
ncbi:MAG: hypothetical protein ACKO2P_07670 [Planctomycetota bacterium]